MAKLGRYSADRKKVQSITDDISLTVADCGTLMVLNKAAGATVTLPSIADAGKGWWVRFVVGTNCTSNSYIITEKASADTDTIRGGINELEVDDGEDGESSTGCTFITFPNGTDTVGDFAEVICDGTNWYVHGQAKLDGGCTLT